jgi:hypothetical protein
MPHASFNLSPPAYVYFYLSLPAKSMKCNLDVLIVYTPLLDVLLSKVIVKTA